MAESWERIRDGLVAVVEARTKNFLAANAPVKAMLVERASRLAKLTVLYAVATTPDMKVSLHEQMGVVAQTITNDLSALAVNASAEAHATFVHIVGTAFDTVVRSLPGIIAIL